MHFRVLALLTATTIVLAVAACNPTTGVPTPTPSSQSRPPSAALSIRVAGGALVDQAGRRAQLRGVNVSGTQYACTDQGGYGIFDGPSDDASITAIRSWNVNAVRVSLNEDCWLGINHVQPAYSGAAYRDAITNYVHRIVAQGMYVILDLTASAPGTEIPAGDNNAAPMADRDHSPTFWSSVARTFASAPAVLFDLHNEPNPDGSRNTTAAWRCVRDGGTCPGVPFVAAGSQEMLDAVRRAGASNVVLVGGPQFAGVLDRWSEWKPRDPLGQLAASIHIYFNTPQSPDWSPCYLQSCWEAQLRPLARTVPVVIGEFGEHDCSFGLLSGRKLTPPQRPLLDWADEAGVSYLGWAWFTGNCADEPALVRDYHGTPTAFGAGVRDHLRARR
jgi:endoglucanase